MKAGYCIVVAWILILSQSSPLVLTADASSDTVAGWTVEKVSGPELVVKTCTATWNKREPAELAIIAEGSLLTLTIASPLFGGEKREEKVSLRKEKVGKVERTARAAGTTYSVTIDNDVDSYLEQEGPFILTVKGVDYTFSIDNVSPAIDAVRRCVGQPTKSEMQANNAPSFPTPKGWESLVLEGGCAARLSGDEVDTMVSINNKDQVLLIAGRRDWNSWGEEVKLTLQFDSQPPRSFTAWKWNNLVLLVLVDDKDVVALRKASTLKWHLSTGDYSANVSDVGLALDAASACTKGKRVVVSH